MTKTMILGCVLLLAVPCIWAQQDPQYTHYQYNTLTVNPGYTGSLGHLSITGLYRSQWVGIEGAPQTLSLGIDSPFKKFDGLGLSIAHDEIGPAQETYIDGNYAHSIIVNRMGHRLAFGLKAGGRFLNVDWSKGTYKDPDTAFNENINTEFLPVIGGGLFYYTDNAYVGASVPNVLHNKRYNAVEEEVGTDRLHVYIIAGYVFDLNPNLKFKPSTFLKVSNGGPVIADVSANFLIQNTLNLGVSYRWDDSFSGLIGFNITPRLEMGYAYDYTITALQSYNSGSHEIFFRYQFIKTINKLKSPRFF